MVFESLVADIVNRYLGDFIENLDKSQLKLGIWGGDVVLNNLFVKESALDELDLPVKVLHGNIGKLTLKIPWKNLYGEPTVAILEGLYVVAVPNAGVQYNAEKEAKAAFEAKQKELQRIEDAKKAEAEKHKPKDEKADSFAEKMASNVIKNLQIEISDIHIRYEDHFTNPQHPFAAGVTLKQLSFKTTDENWRETVVKDAVTMIYKMIKLDSLSVYWNSQAEFYTQMEREKLQASLKTNIASTKFRPLYSYLIEPISSTARLRLHTKPEKDNFSLPKILLNVVFDEIAIALNKSQYHNVMELLEALERMNLAAKYKKYRPMVQKRGNTKAWWKFAYKAILEEIVRRRRKMWSWVHIKQHRQYCRDYKEVYKKTLTAKKITEDLQKKLDFYEQQLSVFNITLVRQQAELEVKAASKAKKEVSKKASESGGGWFGGWFGGGGKKEEAAGGKQSVEKEIGDQFAKLMTEDEKKKLYAAIGYQENAADSTLPVEYVATEVHFALAKLSVSLRDPASRPASTPTGQQLLKLAVSEVRADIKQRPAGNAVLIKAAMNTFSVNGATDPQTQLIPEMVSSQTSLVSKGAALLRLEFETNPLDKKCDQRVDLASQPLSIVYDAMTINEIVKFFKPPESVHLKQLQAAAMAKFEDLKEQSAAGLQHAIQQRKYTDITVNLQPTQVMIPEGGVYKRDCRMLLLDLGVLKVSSKKTDIDVKSLTDGGAKGTLDIRKVAEKAYDQFTLKLERVQLLFANPGDEWQRAQKASDSPLHVLRPMDINIELNKSILVDPKLPKMKVHGMLPRLNVYMSDRRLNEILRLVDSIPLPEPDPTPTGLEEHTYSAPDVAEMMVGEGNADRLVKKMAKKERKEKAAASSSSEDEFEDARETPVGSSASKGRLASQSSVEYVNAIDVQLNFEIKEIALHLSQNREGCGDVPILKLVVDSLGTSVEVRTFDLMVSAYLGSVYIQHLEFKASEAIRKWSSQAFDEAVSGGPLINIVNTPTTDDATYRLLYVEYVKANPRGPEFATTYNNTEQKIKVSFTALEILLHQEAILSIMAFAQTLKPPEKPAGPQQALEEAPADTAAAAADASGKIQRAVDEAAIARKEEIAAQRRRRLRDSDVIDIAVEANLGEFALAVCTQERLLTDIKVKGISAKVTVYKAKTSIEASISDLAVHNPADGAMYPRILTFEGGEVFRLHIDAHNGATEGDDYHNMEKVDTAISFHTGTMKIVFLNKFVMDLLAFLDKFSAAKDKLAAAGSAAAESAAAKAQDLASKNRASRLKLDVSLKAPVIIIPQNSSSTNALLVDLGLITVKNQFQTAGKYTPEGVPAVLDNMIIQLSSMKLSRANILGVELRAECCILQPVNIDLNLSRNLSVSWYHGHPDINIDGKLKAITVDLSQGDFTTIMSVLNENLQEGQQPPPAQPASYPPSPAASGGGPQQETAIVAQSSPPVSASPSSVVVHAQAGQQQPLAAAAAEVYAKMKFSFRIESVKAVLYKGSNSLVSGVSVRDDKNGLGKFELQTIAVEGAMKSDSSMRAAVILAQCVLDDKRPGKENSVTRMVERSSLGSQQSNMIDVTFVQQLNSNKDLDVKVNGLYVCVCVDYLMAIADFFVKGMPKPAEGAPLPAPTAAAVAAKSSTTAAVASAPQQPPAGEININLIVDQPEIILVENAMNPDTQALILQTQVTFNLRMTPEVQKISGSVSDLEIFSCLFALEKRHKSKTQILTPATIALHSSAPQGRGMHMDIMVTDIIMNISPATISLITAALSSLSTPPEAEEEEDMFALIPKDLWSVKKLTDCDFWYLKTALEEEGTDVDLPLVTDDVYEDRGEQLLLTVSKIVMTLEGGVGKRTVPLLITEMAFRSEVLNWSTKLAVSGDVSMEVAYYNEYNAVWEPLLEPVEVQGKHRPWELGLEVETNNELIPLEEEDTDVVDSGPSLPPPKMAIMIRSKDLLQTTITKTCLEVLQNLGKAFSDAYNQVEKEEVVSEIQQPYRFKNTTGQIISLKLDPSFELPSVAVDGHVELGPGEQLSLNNSAACVKEMSQGSIIKMTQEDQQKTVFVIMEDLGATRELRVVKAEKRAFGINQRAYPGEVWTLVAQTDVSYGCKTITLRSILEVHNHLPYTMELYYKLSDDAMGRCGEIAPHQTLNVPMDAVYSAPYQLFFKPRDARFGESKTVFNWKEMKGDQVTVSCHPTNKGLQPLYFSAKVSTEMILYESTGEKSAELYSLHLQPVVVLRNDLPVSVEFSLDVSDEASATPSVLEPGHSASLFNAKPGNTKVKIKILEYLGREWLGSRLIEDKPDPMSVVTFETQGAGEKKSMDLGLHCNMEKGFRELSLYCPYWMINKTGRTIVYKAADDYSITHDGDNKQAILFSFKSKAFFGKKKASLKVGDSEWSDKFSLDTVGSRGTISCKFKGYTFELGVKITLASTGLTKIITFTPYYMIINQAKFPISVKETLDNAVWCDVAPGACVPFWPVQTEKKKKCMIRLKEEEGGGASGAAEMETKPFCFVEPHTALLRVGGAYGGVNVECQVMEAAVEIVCQQYTPGSACVQLVNHTSKATVTYCQSGVNDVRTLGPGQSVLYTWQDPLGRRELIWSSGEKKNQKNELLKDVIDQFMFDPDTPVFYVSFLDGMQRVMLFTEDLALATKAQQAGELEQTAQEITVSLAGVGLSLVDNFARREIAYMGIMSSGVIWEMRKKKMYKAFKQKQIIALETAYQIYLMELQVGKNPKSKVTVDGGNGKMEVDFATNQMFKPSKMAIRRSFEDGVWLQYSTSPHRLQYHIKIHKLQLDNQLPGAVFPTVLARIPPPKSVAADSVPKPFTEISITIRKRDYSKVLQFKYCKILVQEMSVQLDQGFLNAILGLFMSKEAKEEEMLQLFEADRKMISTELIEDASQSSQNEQKHFYDNLHFSPLKIHLSFSLYGAEKDGNQPTQLHSNVLNLFLQSVGIVLTDIQDVIFKLGYFERNYSFYNQSQLTNEIAVHYSQQAIKQMYVLVLGLDVLGNPFGLIRGFAEGIEDLFYEPYQGAIQGPQEFAEGLALGVRSLFGHAVGGAAGAVGRITGALGKGIATLTMDEDYQRKRREQLNKRPADLKEGLARGGKGLVMGVVDGVTGIVLRPVEGAKADGAAGFFKGVGKGLMGVVTRPASGVVDFASSSFQGIQRVAEMGDEVHRLRPPRFLHDDGIVRAFVFKEAEGNDILNDVAKSKFATDVYVAHAIITKDRRNVLLVTEKRVLFATKGEIFGHWECEWQYTYEELKEAPKLTSKGIQVLLKEKQKKTFFSSGSVGKLVQIENKAESEWIVKKMQKAFSSVATSN